MKRTMAFLFLFLSLSLFAKPTVEDLKQRSLAAYRLVQAEQTLNDRTEDTEQFASINEGNTLSKKFMPENQPVFRLWTVHVPKADLRVFGLQTLPGQLVYTDKNGVEYVKFPVHPASENKYRSEFGKYKWTKDFVATPLASHRSMIVWNPDTQDPPMAIKVSLDQVVGQVVRNLKIWEIKRTQVISEYVNTLDKKALAKQGIIFMDDPTGVMPLHTDAGFQVRSLDFPKNAEIIPMFSYFAKLANGKSKLAEAIEKSGEDPMKFIRKRILEPLVRQQAEIYFNYGLTTEPHEQNMLIELENGIPTGRFWYRDFGGMNLDPRMLDKLGLREQAERSSASIHLANMRGGTMIDTMKTYLIDSNFFAMAKAIEGLYPGVTTEQIKEAAQAELLSRISEHIGAKVETIPQARRAVHNFRLGKECKNLYSAAS